MKQHYGVLLLLTVVLACSWLATSASATLQLRAHLTHVDSGRGFTKRELLHRMVVRSKARAAKLCPSGSGHGSARPVTAPVASGSGVLGETEYLIHLGIGTPRPQHVALEVDTGSDVVWTQCQPCVKCFRQHLPRFDTSASDTIREVACSDPLCRGLKPHACLHGGCSYQVGYGDKSWTIGQLAKDSFTFQDKGGAAVTVPDMAFGCGHNNTGNFLFNESGIAGFGRGPLSLPEQLRIGSFSYCFTTIFDSKSSPVFLGAPDDLRAHATGPIISTPFVRNAPAPPYYYYLSLKGVTVGKTRLPIPESAFTIKADGSGGTILDSGTAITAFPPAVFRSLWAAFVSQVPLPHTSYDEDKPAIQCFFTESVPDASKVPVPKLILHLEGGADWELPRENYMADLGVDQMCLIVSPAGVKNRIIIGNFQQQNMHIVHDLDGNKLVIVPAQCDKM